MILTILCTFLSLYFTGLFASHSEKGSFKKYLLSIFWPFFIKKDFILNLLIINISLLVTLIFSVELMLFFSFDEGTIYDILLIFSIFGYISGMILYTLSMPFVIMLNYSINYFIKIAVYDPAKDNPVDSEKYKSIFRNFKFFIFIIAMIFVGLAFVTTYKKKLKNQNVMAKKVVNLGFITYKSSGLSGLIKLSGDCYENLKNKSILKNLEKCVMIDVFSENLDRQMATEVGFPVEEYFKSEKIIERANPHFLNLNKSEIESMKYLNEWEVSLIKAYNSKKL